MYVWYYLRYTPMDTNPNTDNNDDNVLIFYTY